MKSILAFFDTDLHFDWKVVLTTIVSTTLILVDFYIRLTDTWLPTPWWKYVDRTILYLIIPLLVILVVFRENPARYGFGLGDWRAGLILTGLAALLLIPVIWFAGRGQAEMQAYYWDDVNGLPWTTFLDLFGWEFLFRGWLLFGYARRFGADALWLQSVPFALAHIGKPGIETFTTIFGGFAFGWIAWRTRSFLYPFLIHWFLATGVILVAAGRIG
jgi:membrane protease YdiL (CAAX protease family)